jgi:hypothetical protein
VMVAPSASSTSWRLPIMAEMSPKTRTVTFIVTNACVVENKD